MLHLIVELFGVDLITMVHLQRLTAAIIADRIRPILKDRNSTVTRSGDDVFVEGGKLTVASRRALRFRVSCTLASTSTRLRRP
jgi:hypothetical protein